jgi:hypothetical protein
MTTVFCVAFLECFALQYAVNAKAQSATPQNMALVRYSDTEDAQLVQRTRQLEWESLKYEEANLRFKMSVLEYKRDQFCRLTQPNMHHLCQAVDIASADSEYVDEQPLTTASNALAGKRVGVFWKGMKRWYEGVITETRQFTKALVKYDDGEEHWEEEWTNATDIKRCAHCPKPKGHMGRCLGAKRVATPRDAECFPNVQKRARVATAKLGINDGWGEEVTREWRTRAWHSS